MFQIENGEKYENFNCINQININVCFKLIYIGNIGISDFIKAEKLYSFKKTEI